MLAREARLLSQMQRLIDQEQSLRERERQHYELRERTLQMQLEQMQQMLARQQDSNTLPPGGWAADSSAQNGSDTPPAASPLLPQAPAAQQAAEVRGPAPQYQSIDCMWPCRDGMSEASFCA